jgi:hypothetical protein
VHLHCFHQMKTVFVFDQFMLVTIVLIIIMSFIHFSFSGAIEISC